MLLPTMLYLLLFSVTLVTDSASSNRPFTVEDMMNVKNLVESQISPDGKQVAFVSTDIDRMKDQFVFQIDIVDRITGDRTEIASGPADYSPRWSPEGDRVAFLKSNEGRDQICIYDLRREQTTQCVAFDSTIENFNWTPQGDRIVFFAPESSAQQVGKPNHQLYVVDVAAKRTRALARVPGHVTGFSFSPDAPVKLVVSVQASPAIDDLMEQDLYIVPVDERLVGLGPFGFPISIPSPARPFVVRPGLDTMPEWSLDGQKIAFQTTAGGSRVFDEAHIEIVSVDESLAATDPRRFPMESLSRMDWSADSRSLLISRQQGVEWHLVKLDLATGETQQITKSGKVYRNFSFSADRQWAAFHIDDTVTTNDVNVSRLDRFQPQRLTDLNPQLRGFQRVNVRAIRWSSFDGRQIEGVLYTPANYDSEEKLPLVVRLHGGPSGGFQIGFNPEGLPSQQVENMPPQVLTSLGYAVLAPNPRGSSGYGQEFVELAIGDWANGPYLDVMSGIDHLIDAGIVDANQVGIGGYCYGGFLTNWAITQTDRFRCALPFAGISNIASHFGTTDVPGHSVDYFAGGPGDPGTGYHLQSPVFQAGKIMTPVLLQHGAGDERVSASQSVEMAASLRQAAVEHKIMIYPGEGHVMVKPSHLRMAMQANIDWIQKWMPVLSIGMSDEKQSMAATENATTPSLRK